VELAARIPRVRILALEPWPELFSLLIERCQFLHKLPESALIVGADDISLPGWRDVWSRRARRLKTGGFNLKLFPNPLTARLLPEGFSASLL